MSFWGNMLGGFLFGGVPGAMQVGQTYWAKNFYGDILENKQAGGLLAISQLLGGGGLGGSTPLGSNPMLASLLPFLVGGFGGNQGGLNPLAGLLTGGLPGLIQGLILQQMLGSLGGNGLGASCWEQRMEQAYAQGKLDGYKQGVADGLALGVSSIA